MPAALPVLLGGLRIGATLSVIGAVVGEFVGANRGLGFLINVGRGMFDTALVFVAVFALVAMAMALYGSVALLEMRLLAWQQRPGEEKRPGAGDGAPPEKRKDLTQRRGRRSAAQRKERKK